jgi:hypothetical protein
VESQSVLRGSCQRTGYCWSGNFLTVPLLLHIHANSVAGADLRADHAPEIWLFGAREISSLHFSVFHSPRFLRIPLAVFLTIPLLIWAVDPVFSHDSTAKICGLGCRTVGLGCGKGEGSGMMRKQALLVSAFACFKPISVSVGERNREKPYKDDESALSGSGTLRKFEG